MRVEHDGRCAVVGWLGGSPKHPLWYFNIEADPHVELQDGPRKQDMTAHEATDEERAAAHRRGQRPWPAHSGGKSREIRRTRETC